jgi:NADPH:quinone reductase-like Zn-dependent oxidoreductase
MKAAVITEHGELDKVNLVEIAQPRPGRGEVLIQVKSAALNHLDIRNMEHSSARYRIEDCRMKLCMRSMLWQRS